jgi:hypothetical protein
MLNWFSCKPASVEPVAIDRKPKTLTDGVQDPEVQRQLDAVRRIIDAYSDDVGSIAWEHTKAIREALRELLISPGVSEHDFLIVSRVWTALIDDLRVTAAAHGAATQLDQARQTSGFQSGSPGDPTRIGSDQVRGVRFKGERMVLIPPPRLTGESEEHREITWERIAAE